MVCQRYSTQKLSSVASASLVWTGHNSHISSGGFHVTHVTGNANDNVSVSINYYFT